MQQQQRRNGSAGGGMKVVLGEGVKEALSGLSGGEGAGLVTLVCFYPTVPFLDLLGGWRVILMQTSI